MRAFGGKPYPFMLVAIDALRPFKHLGPLEHLAGFFSLSESKLVSASAYEDFCSLPRGSRRGAPAPHGAKSDS